MAREIQGGQPNMCRFITLAREPLVTGGQAFYWFSALSFSQGLPLLLTTGIL